MYWQLFVLKLCLIERMESGKQQWWRGLYKSFFMVTRVQRQQQECTVFRRWCLRSTEGKKAIDYAQNFVPKYDFQKYRKWAANFALRKAFYGINKNFLLRLAYRIAEANSISHNFETKKWHSWENILHLYKTTS